jgi:hypothetical protein
MNKLLFCLPAILSLTCTSCGNRAKIYPVSGSITYQGLPAAGAAVFFYPHGGGLQYGPMIMGVVMPDGSFELSCGSLGKGAPPGEYDVVIEWKQRAAIPNGRQGGMPDKLNGHYADPRHPLLHAKVEADANQLPPFDLTAESRS